MIKSFKIFEGHNIERKLVSQLNDKFIDKFFDKYYLRDAKEIIELWPNTIWKHIDDKEYVKNFIEEEINSLSIDDFNDYDYKQYLENNISDNKEKKVLKLYNLKQIRKGGEIEYEYDSDMLTKLSEKQLRKIIKDENEEEDFVNYIITDRYENNDARDIIENIYGEKWIYDNGRELYDIFSDYFDDDDIVEDWKEDTNKESELQEHVYDNAELQRKLLKIKKENVLLLAELFIEQPDSDNISGEYDFQKLFINMYIKKHIKNNKDENYLRAEALKYLNQFEINEDIEEEYKDDMWLISADKYNI